MQSGAGDGILSAKRGRVMPKIVDPAAMQDRILDAAQRVFEDLGVHATTVSDIAEAAGLGKGTLYLYFDNKETLIAALARRIISRTVARLSAMAPATSLDGFVTKLGVAMQVPAAQASHVRLCFEVLGPGFTASRPGTGFGPGYDRAGQRFARQIKALQSLGEVAPHHDANACGRALVAMIEGMVMHRGLFDLSPRRYRAMVRQALVLFRAGLKN